MNSLKAINLCKSYETNNESVDVLDEINPVSYTHLTLPTILLV